MPKWSRGQVDAAVAWFIATSDELTSKAWTKSMPMSSSVATRHLAGVTFSEAICAYAAQHAPAQRVYAWPQCPAGQRHQAHAYYRGTAEQWKAGKCALCDEQAERKRRWLEGLPTFAEAHPALVPYLHEPRDAQSRGMVEFICADCGARPIPWSPKSVGPPVCSWCRARDGRQPGELVPRRGGGAAVRLESELAAAVHNHGVQASAEHGVVTERGTYVVPVIKPDVVLPDMRVAIEIDNSAGQWGAHNHDRLDGVEDDQLRDALLAFLGWRVLRIRRPDQAVIGDWPWRVESTSTSPRRLAALVVGSLPGG